MLPSRNLRPDQAAIRTLSLMGSLIAASAGLTLRLVRKRGLAHC